MTIYDVLTDTWTTEIVGSFDGVSSLDDAGSPTHVWEGPKRVRLYKPPAVGYTEVAGVANRPDPIAARLAEGHKVHTTNSKLTWTVFGGAYRSEPDSYTTAWATQSEMITAGTTFAADFVEGVIGVPRDTNVLHDFIVGSGFQARPAPGGSQTIQRNTWQAEMTSVLEPGNVVSTGTFAGVEGTTGSPPLDTVTALAANPSISIRVNGSEVAKSDTGSTYNALHSNTSTTGVAFTRQLKVGDVVEVEQVSLT